MGLPQGKNCAHAHGRRSVIDLSDLTGAQSLSAKLSNSNPRSH